MGSSPTDTWKSKWIKIFLCHAGHQVDSKCYTMGGSKDYAGDKPWKQGIHLILKPRPDVTRNPKQGTSYLKEYLCPSNSFLKAWSLYKVHNYCSIFFYVKLKTFKQSFMCLLWKGDSHRRRHFVCTTSAKRKLAKAGNDPMSWLL